MWDVRELRAGKKAGKNKTTRGIPPGFLPLDPLESRVMLTSVISVSPANLSIGVAVDPDVSVVFGSAMNASTINSGTIELFDSNNNLVAGRVSYNADDLTATFNATAELSYAATYHAVVVSGSSGVEDSGNNPLASNISFSFTTAPNPSSGTVGGGPILVVTSTSNAFSSYYPEILRAEGLNEFATADISTITSTVLSNYSVVILSQTPLTSAQVTTLTTWVNNGGHLIAMRPDSQLATLLGITPTGNTVSNTYMEINTASGPGVGITGTTMQFHGTADQYSVSGATVVASLYADANDSLPNPAVTSRSVGTKGGTAAAFSYDLAESIIETRQGNPAWSGEARDGNSVIRPDDLFFGDDASDPEPDWIDLSKVQIPQADEQQRLLANMIESAELGNMPLPRFWYLPNNDKAVIVLTGDDHDEQYSSRNTADAFNYYLGQGSAGGQPIVATSYMFTGSITDAQAAQFVADGFEVALHTEIEDSSGNPINWTSESELNSLYQSEIATFEAAYPSLAAPRTNRMHAVVWSDYASQPQVEYANGIRMDTSYYYWPGNWTGNNPGFFTGSGLPQLFATSTGQVIDVFQAATQLTDENSAIQWSQWLNTLLSNATGADGYYGAFTVNAHADTPLVPQNYVPQEVIAAAREYNVPIITTQDLLNFEDGRDGSYFSTLAWNATTNSLSYSMTLADQSSGLTAMVPLKSSTGLTLSSLKVNGTAVNFTVQTIKGIAYAFYAAAPGSYVAQYSSDTTRPTVSAHTPTSSATGVLSSISLSATFSEDVVPSSISFTLVNSSSAQLQGTVSYNSATHTATFTPNEALPAGATFTASVSGAMDDSGNVMTGATSWSFTTTSTTGPYSVFPSTASPSASDVPDPNSVEVGMKFQSTVPGYVTGVRFYKGTNNTGTHVGSLWDSNGDLLGSVTFTGETASGWQQANFTTPIFITANTTYTVSYLAPNGNYAADAEYFALGGTSSGYLTGLADGADGEDGVYLYTSIPAFPAETYNASNYWVDVAFTAAPPSDTTAPTITSRTPASGATGVPTNATISATFGQIVKTDGTLSIVVNNGTSSVAGTLSYVASTRTAVFTPTAALTAGTTYTVTLNAAGLGGTAMSPATWSFTTAPANTYSFFSDSVVPSVVDSQVSTPTEVGLKFQSTVAGYVTGMQFYKGTANTGTHVGHLWDASGDLLATVTFTNESTSGWQTAMFSSPVAIAANTYYTISYYAPNGHYSETSDYFDHSFAVSGPLTAFDTDESQGNGAFVGGSGYPNQTLNGTNYWVDVVFATAVENTQPPFISAQSPASNATNVPTNSSITATFNEQVKSDSSLSITLKNGNTTVPGTLSYNSGAFTASFTPTAPLTVSTTYTVTVAATDLSGNVMSPVSWSFTTSASNNYSVFGGTGTPSVIDDADPNAVELGMKFQSSVSGWVTGVSFYKGATNTGTHIGHLWSSSGTLLATVTFTNETASGWQTASFSNPVAITANTAYVISYYAPDGHYSDTSGYFASSGVTDGPLTAPSNTIADGNGVYAYDTGGGFPNQTFNSANYWVDVQFTTTSPVDNTPPSIVSQSPASGATNVSTSAPITVQFSEPVKSDASLSITLKNGGTSIAGTLSYNSSTNTATFAPTAALALSTTYSVTVTATDLSGNVMTPATWSFTTSASNNYSVFGGSGTPAVTADPDSSSVELGMKFQSNVAGWVTGVTFYKGSTSTGTHVGHLWSSTGTLLATVTFTNETASGWQTANFSNPVAITAGTTYIISYYAPNGHYADTSGYFASTGVTNGPLTAPSNTVSGGNGVYLYGTGGGFPNQTFSSTNYWVDVLFTTTQPVDTTPPSIISQSPASAATGVTVNSPITVQFSESVKTDASLSITLKTGGTTVPGTLSYNAGTDTATFTPTAQLAISSTYIVTVTATDLSGNVMTPASWSFATSSSKTYGIFAPNAVPTLASSGDTNAVEVGMEFSSSVAGFVTGVRFYKGAGNTGTHVGHLWNANGTLLATVTFTGETASGWQTALFSSPVAITAGTSYIVSYYAPNGDYSADNGYFANPASSLDGGLTAPAAINGVYRYGTGGGFPNATYQDSNYWVDVLFETSL